MIRCTQCGYKNSPVYHYCGVCGAVLQSAPKEEAAPAVTAAPISPSTPAAPASAPAPAPKIPPAATHAERADLPVSGGMSFLGLSDASSSSSPDYLLDDDEGGRSIAWGRIFGVLLLLGAAGGLGWQWHKGGYPFGQRTQTPVATAPAPTSTPPADTSGSAASTPVAPAPSAEVPPPDANKAASEPAASAPAITPEPTPPAETKTETPAETKTEPPTAAESSETAAVKKAPPAVTAEKTEPARVKKTPAPAPEPATVPGEALYVQGQRYLYGTGVAANCDLALKSLLSAASRSHPRAESTLGTMYFTGHCVTRDLPSAYRWFARALRQDPNNSRLEQNLNVIWRQMTPGEQQIAIRKE